MGAATPPDAKAVPVGEDQGATGVEQPRDALLEAGRGVMQRGVEYVRRQLDPDNPATLAGYLSGASDTLTVRRVLLAFVACAVAGIGEAFKPGAASAGVETAVMLLFLASLAALIPVHLSPDRRVALGGVALSVALGAVLIFTYANVLCVVIFALLAIVLVFRFRWNLSLPALGIVSALFAALLLLQGLLQGGAANPWADVARGVSTFAIVAAVAIGTRSRALVLRRLRDTERQLRAEMARTAELATTRERARIARDMHDVLAHSLTVVSIQTQAARQVVLRDPERAAGMLDDIAGLLKKSIAESRHLVGVLRDTERSGGEDSSLGARLVALADAFGERSGVRCVVRETGRARALSAEQEHTLLFALQEALTNAYRHGAAARVNAALDWREVTVVLTVEDDGHGTVAGATAANVGNGLRGMRERAEALGGTVRAGPRASGEFEVVVTLPIGAAG